MAQDREESEFGVKSAESRRLAPLSRRSGVPGVSQGVSQTFRGIAWESPLPESERGPPRCRDE